MTTRRTDVDVERRSGVERRAVPRGTRDRRRRSVDKVSCPVCTYPVSAVLDSRGVVRLRVCDECGASYTTTENVGRVLPRGTRSLAKSEKTNI
jgi:uncharacterized protein YbaR (Trm112 family)